MHEAQGKASRAFSFKAEVQEDEDGRWSAWIDLLPGCAAWGYSQEEALQGLQDAAQAYVTDMVEAGEQVPNKEQPPEPVMVTVTV